LISVEERDDLTAAYCFLRDAEHKLQMVHDLQTHELPASGEELERCAIRSGYDSEDRRKATERFHADHQRHTGFVNRFFRSFFYQPTTSLLLKSTLRAVNRSR
jgi:glutamate-ammonia-ligase adenylyltransferase